MFALHGGLLYDKADSGHKILTAGVAGIVANFSVRQRNFSVIDQHHVSALARVALCCPALAAAGQCDLFRRDRRPSGNRGRELIRHGSTYSVDKLADHRVSLDLGGHRTIAEVAIVDPA
jgi:hypothetical protein